MVFQGGSSSKKGDEYERIWTVRCILQVIRGDFKTIQIEPVGENGEGIEFILTGERTNEYHQVKRQNTHGSWTLARLHNEGILQSIWNRLHSNKDKFIFVSTSDAKELRELANIAEQLDDWELFSETISASNQHTKNFEQLCDYLQIDTDNNIVQLFSKLQRVQVRTGDERTLEEANYSVIQSLFPASLNQVKPIADEIFRLVPKRLYQKLTTSDLLAELKSVNKFSEQKFHDETLNHDEIRKYLETTITQLENRIGVLQYVSLQTFAYIQDDDENSIDPNFSVILNRGKKIGTSVKKEKLNQIQNAVKLYNHFVLIGNPGAGKTTTLLKLARQEAVSSLQTINENGISSIPFFVELPKWRDDDRDIEDFIRAQFVNWNFGIDPIKLLFNGYGTLYLDGLNEMGSSGVRKTAQLRRWLKAEDDTGTKSIAVLAPSKVIITCRKEDYLNFDYDLRVPIIEAEELDNDRIEMFIDNYLYEHGDDFKRLIFAPTQRGNQLLSLARNPYRLVLLILLHKTSPTGELPRNTGLLFQQMVKQLWMTEQNRRPNLNIDYEIMVRELARLAFTMIDAGMPTRVPLKYASLYVNNPGLMKSINGIFARVDGNEVTFDHQLTQEYFAAEALKVVGVNHITISYPKDLERDDSKHFLDYFFQKDDLARFALPDKWDEVVVALCGIVSNVDEVISRIATVNPFLAIRCIRNVGIEDYTIDLVPHLIQALKQPNINVKGKALQALGEYGDDRALEHLFNFFDDETAEIRFVARKAIVALSEFTLIPLLNQLQNSIEDKAVYAGLIQQMGTKIIPVLEEFLLNSDSIDRQHIYIVLGNIGGEDAQNILVRSIDTEKDFVREQVIISLGQIVNTESVRTLCHLLLSESSTNSIIILKSLENFTNRKRLGSNRKHPSELYPFQQHILDTLMIYLPNVKETKILIQTIKLVENIYLPDAINLLDILFHNEHWQVHYNAYNALMEFRNTKVKGKSRAQYLTGRINALSFQTHFEKALESLYTELGKNAIIFSLQHHHKSGQVYWRLARELSKIIVSLDREDILSMLYHDNYHVKAFCAYAIGNNNSLINYGRNLIDLLDDSRPFVKGQAVRSLGKLKFSEAINQIAELLNDEKKIYSDRNIKVRDYAKTALEDIGTDEALEILKRTE